jgi:hypothetical protein
MATIQQLAARLIDLFGPASSANPTKLYGNLMVSPNGNILVGSTTDNGVQKLQVTGNALVTGYVARTQQVAFCMTQYTYTTVNFAAGQAVVMGSNTWPGVTMQCNVGGGFSTTTGNFTAPIAGTYVFTASLTTDGGNARFDLIKNGAAITSYGSLNYGTNWITASNTWVVTLAAGDTVYCSMGAVNGTTVSSFGNSFSGWLI